MPTFWNWSGFDRADALDRLTPRTQLALFAAVTCAVTFVELYVVYYVLHIATLEYDALFFLELAVLSLPFAWIVLQLRKTSSVVPILLVAVPFLAADFYLDAHVRPYGPAWWSYGPGTLLDSWPPLARTLFEGGGDGFFAGPVCLFLARLVAGRMGQPGAAVDPTRAQTDALFPDPWTAEPVDRPARGASFWVPRLIGFAYVAYLALLVLGAFGPTSWPDSIRDLFTMSYANPALTINTYEKIALVAFVASVAAFNPRLRYHAGIALLFAHVVSTVASIAFYFAFPDAPAQPRSFLLASAAADGVMAAALAAIVFTHRDAGAPYRGPDEQRQPAFSLPEEMAPVLYWGLVAVAVVTSAVILGVRIYADPDEGIGAVYGGPDPLVCNSLTKYAMIGALALLSARRPGLRDAFGPVLATGFAIGALTSLAWLVAGASLTGLAIQTADGSQVDVPWQFAGNVVLDGLACLLIRLVERAHYDVDLAITSLSPASARGIRGFATGVMTAEGGPGGEAGRVDPLAVAEVATRIDGYAGGLRGRKRALLNFPFALLESVFPAALGLYPRLSAMSPEEGAFWLRRHVLRPPSERARSPVPPLADALYLLGIASHGLVTLARYSSVRGGSSIAFVPSDARDRLQGEFAAAPPPFSDVPPLPKSPDDAANFTAPLAPKTLVAPRVYTPLGNPRIPDEADYVVVGSGAGGAVAAYRLASADPKARVVVVETGSRYAPPRDFTDDELEMLRKLYKEGGLQQTKRADLVVLQGEAVGGSTVINNAICASMPPEVRDLWVGEYALGDCLANLDEAYAVVRRELAMEALPETAVNQRVAAAFRRAVAGYNDASEAPERLDDVPLLANMRLPLGTGTDNIGDRHARKRSMLETYLPWAEANGAVVLSDTTALAAVESASAGGRRATHVVVRDALGHARRIAVRKGVVVAAGSIASSHFLLRSGCARPVGTKLACNFALPAAFLFDDEMRAFDGTQITLGVRKANGPAIFETYFNPPAAFALSLSFHFQRHREAMAQYPRLANFGALVGSELGGTVDRLPDPVLGTSLQWSLDADDVAHLRYGLSTLVRLGRAAGARRAWLPTDPGIALDLDRDVDDFCRAMEAYPLRMSDLRLATAHPQGGNRLIGDASPHQPERAVDATFRAVGWTNLFVADASLFPTGIGVNPQWTVMALSTLAMRSALAEVG